MSKITVHHEVIKIGWSPVEIEWNYAVIIVATEHPDGSRWEKTLRSPHYSKGEWERVHYLMKKGCISQAELSELQEIARKEAGPFEVKLGPFGRSAWRGLSA